MNAPWSIVTVVTLLGNHLWQSTLVLIVAALLTRVLKRNHAQVRYWIWCTASLKFLVPFAPLVLLGRHLQWISSVAQVQPATTILIDSIGEPFVQPALRASVRTTMAAFDVSAILATLCVAVWLAGAVALLLVWWTRWRHLTYTIRTAAPIQHGRELDIVRRLESLMGIRRPTTLASSTAALEPGVFGIVRPTLLWPCTITRYLTDPQIVAILAHEVCHVRRRDNVIAALHMFVEAVFWFHPLIWWVEHRLIDERERACDEDVLGLGNEPHVYAESILKTCQFYVELPLACVAGVTGADLKKRIEAIMRNRDIQRLNTWRKLLLATIGAAAVVGPLVVGALTAPRLLAQTPASTDGKAPTFEVASIKPNKSGSRQVNLNLEPGGRLTATNVSLMGLISVAYADQGPLPPNRVSVNAQWIGGGDYLASDHFDVQAKADGELTRSQLPHAVQVLLADRFKLIVHHETKELPMYALVLVNADGRLGPHLKRSTVDCSDPGTLAETDADGKPLCGFRRFPGKATGRATMADLAKRLLNGAVDDHRPVEDRTGLAGTFEFDVEWTPQLPVPADAPQGPPIDPTGPSLFTAVKEQLGLKLDPRKDQIDVLVIDHAEHPTEN